MVSQLTITMSKQLLRAYTDDSASEIGDRRLFVAGYVAPSRAWGAFNREWAVVLSSPPAITYLKSSEAVRLHGEFSGWTTVDRDVKLQRFTQLINTSSLLSFHLSVSRDAYDRFVKPFAPRGLQNAHFACCFGILPLVARYVVDQYPDSRIKFTFDQQDGVNDDIILFLDYMLKSLPAKAQKVIDGTPSFVDDKLVFGLQAADLLACELRLEHEGKFTVGSGTRFESIRNPHGHLQADISDSMLSGWGTAFSAMPGLNKIQTKARWRSLKTEIRGALIHGYVPPHGTRWKNTVHALLEWIERLLGR
jgi:hypothetical protein